MAAELTASDGAICDQLGRSVGLSGSTIVAGAPGAFIASPDRPSGGNADQGAVYLFTQPAGGWANGTQSAKLTAADGLPSDDLGISVATSGTAAFAGAPGATNGSDQGVAYAFTENGGA